MACLQFQHYFEEGMKIEIHEQQVYTFFVRDMAPILVGITRQHHTAANTFKGEKTVQF
jgi:hypothetical protein